MALLSSHLFQPCRGDNGVMLVQTNRIYDDLTIFKGMTRKLPRVTRTSLMYHHDSVKTDVHGHSVSTQVETET